MKTRYLRLVKKQRGFTLIELLAVILILGIIALIAIPTVSSVVEQSRKGAAESSASQFVTSVGELIMASELNGNKIEDGIYSSSELSEKGLNIKGTMPDSGYIQIENSEVVACNFTYGNYNVVCNESDYNVLDSNDTIKFTLKDDNDSNNEISIGDKVCLNSECFYVININGDDIRMLAEWNLNVGYDIKTTDGSYVITDVSNWSYDSIDEAYFINGTKHEDITPKSTKIKQDSNYRGFIYSGTYQIRGVLPFSKYTNENYNNSIKRGFWTTSDGKINTAFGSTYPTNLLNYEQSKEYIELYRYMEYYANNLRIIVGDNIKSISLITSEELENLKCTYDSSCTSEAKKWVYQTSYWTGSAVDFYKIAEVRTNKSFLGRIYYYTYAGVRPVITISKDLISVS